MEMTMTTRTKRIAQRRSSETIILIHADRLGELLAFEDFKIMVVEEDSAEEE